MRQCLAGKGFALLVPPAHAHSRCALLKLPLKCEEWACSTVTVEQDRSWGRGTNWPPTLQIIPWLIQWNVYKKILSIMCICSSHIPIFQTSRNMKVVIFSDNSISHIAISTFTCEQWEVADSGIKKNKVALPWMLYFWIALGHTALPRSAAEGIPSF